MESFARSDGQMDPGQVDPAQVDPGQIDPAQIDPGQNDPWQMDPGQMDPVQETGSFFSTRVLVSVPIVVLVALGAAYLVRRYGSKRHRFDTESAPPRGIL